jgi:hypothetical protein
LAGNAKQRLGIEKDHEAQIFGQGINFFHIENWYSIYLLIRLRCSFSPDNGPPENYVGHINRLGLDIGAKAGGVMAWGVFALTAGLHHGALAGKYVGDSSSASLGVGVGANALIGGSHRSIALHPLSVEGQVGVNLALGLTLSPAP